MPPNIHLDVATRSRLEDFYNGEEEHLLNSDPFKDSHQGRHAARRVWKSMITNDRIPLQGEEECRVQKALSSIRILDCPERNRQWLNDFGGTLMDAPLETLQALKTRAPTKFTARVADFNDNLFYEMQNQRGLEHMGLDSSELALNSKEFLGSFLTTESSVPQPPHVDYMWEVLERYSPQDLNIGFFPLTNEGMFLQVWPRNDDSSQTIPGQVIFIPYGKMVLLPAHTIHGGGFRTTLHEQALNGNLRFHLYVARNEAALPEHQTNKYTEPNDKRKELSWRYVDAPRMKDLLQCLFV